MTDPRINALFARFIREGLSREGATDDDILAALRDYPDEEPNGKPDDKRTSCVDIVQEAKIKARSAGRKQLAHYFAADVYTSRNRWIGIPSVIFSTAVATSIFATISESVNVWWRIATGAAAVLAAILSALVTWLAFGERAEKHRVAGAGFGTARNKLDMYLLRFGGPDSADREKALEALEAVVAELNKLEIDSPTLSKKVYAAGQAQFDLTHPLRV